MGLSVTGASPEGAVSYSSVRQSELALDLAHSWTQRQNLADEENTWENYLPMFDCALGPSFCPLLVPTGVTGGVEWN